MLISLIVPCYNEEEAIPIFYKEVKRVLDGIEADHEILFINDGSKDATLEILRGLSREDSHVCYLSFSRNFGKEAAMYAGFCNVRGDYAAVMDVDLQDPPDLLVQMMDILRTGDYDSVAARRCTRRGEPLVRSWFAKKFYQLMNTVSDTDIVDGARDFRLMKREMVDTIRSMAEYNRFSKGIFGWIGFRTCWISYENVDRAAGKTKWSFWKLFRYAVDGVINFSQAPLNVASWFGIFMTVVAFVCVVVVAVRRLAFGDPVAGWASLVCIMTMIGGIQLFCLGIAGQYISKIYLEVKKRPIILWQKAVWIPVKNIAERKENHLYAQRKKRSFMDCCGHDPAVMYLHLRREIQKSFFCDEIYSYGLANSASYAFIDPQSAERYSETGWVDEAYFKQYIEVGSKDGFSMRAAFENQEQDVHPPLYYCLLHAVCFVFRGSFSKWTGLGLNFLILIVTDLLLLDLTSWILRDVKKQLLVMMLWSCSAAGISNILFIRMYLLLTCEMLAFAAFHARVLRRTGQWTFRARDYGLLLLLVAMGGLTHYYFYPFVFFFSGCVCIYLFVCRQIAAMVRYVFSLLGGFALALAVFPATISHVRNSYRVAEVIDNLSGRKEDVYAVYLRWVDQSAFGGSFKILSVVFAVCIVWKCVSWYFFSFQVRFDPPSQSFMLEVKKEERKHAAVWQVVLQPLHVFMGILFLSYVGFGVVAVKGSQIMQNRYIYPLYPVIVLLFVCAAVFCIRQTAAHKHERKILLAVTVWMCLWSIRTYGIDFLYADYEMHQEQAEQVRGSDCLLLYGDTWLDTYTALPLKRIYDETYFLHPSEITEVARILQLRKTKDPVVVCLPDACTQEDAEAILVQIEDAGGFQGHQMVYQYYTQAYRMM